MDWGSTFTAGACRQFDDCVCFIALLGTDVVNDHLLWVHVSYCSTVHCGNKQVFVWGSFLCLGFGSLCFSPLFMTSETGLVMGCLWTSGVRASAFHLPVTLFPTTFACWVLSRAVVSTRGCWWVQLGHGAYDICSLGSCVWWVWCTACNACPTHIAATPDSTAYYVLQISSRCDTLLSQLTFRSCLHSSMLASGITQISLHWT